MSYAYGYPVAAAHARADERAAFIRKTYGHLAGAVLAFAALEGVLLQIPGVGEMSLRMLSGYSWLLVLLAFMGVSYLANRWALSATSRGLQYAGLALYIAAEAVIFLPLLHIASHFFPGAISTAAVLTLMVFLGLTVAVLVTRRDFSFLAPILSIGGFIMLGVILVSIFLPPSNLFFLLICFVMVALACGYIIYQTSAVMHHYRTDQYVAAALALFASVALLFWYILQIVMASQRR